MPILQPTDFNIICTVLGGFISLYGLVSYFVKEQLFLSEALVALIVGVVLGPHGANWIRPINYAQGDVNGDGEKLEAVTLAFSRLVLGVQLVLAGVQLPKKYLIHEWKSLGMLLGPVMVTKWVVTACLVWLLIPKASFVHALAIAACVTPTDPILANNIVKGRFADVHIRPNLQKIITAESGANDGLGYPLVFVALYALKYCIVGAPVYQGGIGEAIRMWFGETIGYVVLLSVVYGAAVGWVAKELLQWAKKRGLVDRESFLVFSIALALFIVGTCGMIGSDDVLACFIAGNVFTLDDWFRLETMDDSLQPTIDMLLNITIFLWLGAVCPWPLLAATPDLPLSRLVAMTALILLFRRPPVILVFRRWIPHIETFKEGLLAGYFGPIGVSAIFYLLVCVEFLREMLHTPGLQGDGKMQVEILLETIRPTVWMCVVASVVVHGITIPFIMLGNAMPGAIRLPTPESTRGAGGMFISRFLPCFGSTSNSTERGVNCDESGLPISEPQLLVDQ